MFGENPVRKQELLKDGSLYISEVFTTIQGEGPLAGTPAIFVRLSGCNLRCEFCDTDFETVRALHTVEQLVTRIMKQHDAHDGAVYLIVITGGEPFIQNIVPFINQLVMNGFDIQIETAGTVTLTEFPWNDVTVVCSPKTGKVHPHFHINCDDWKYIVSSATAIDGDGLPAKMARPDPVRLGSTIWLQPMDEHDALKNKTNQDRVVHLAIKHGHRISLQTHKILEVL